MTAPIRILHLEDDPMDAELTYGVLKEAGLDFEIVQVDSREVFEAALDGDSFDLILADYAIPGYDGLSALSLVRERNLAVPFVLVSGTLGEEVTVDVLKAGATDFVLKENLSRLVPAVERALREAEENLAHARTEKERARLHAAIEQSPDTVVITDADGVIQYVNPAFETITGYDREEVIGENLRVLKSGDHQDASYEEMWNTISQGGVWSGVFVNRRKDGTKYEEETSIKPVFDSKGEIVSYVAVKRDVTEKRRSEAALAASEERFRLLFERNLAGVFRTTLDGVVIDCNLAFASILGFRSPEAMIGENVVDFYRDAEDRFSLVEELRTAGYMAVRELALRRLDGAVVWVMLSASLVSDAERGEVVEGTLVDWTERRQLQDQLAQVQKLEAIGELSGGIAHDFNNLLMAIQTSVDLIELRSPGDHDSQELETIRKTVGRGADLTRRLLAVAQRQVLQMAPVEINRFIARELEMLRRVIPENIHIRFSEGSDLPVVRADRGQLGQVLMNLVVNARDAMPDGGSITLGVAVGKPETIPFPVGDLGDHREKLWIRVSVEDTGCGMDVVTLSRAFEPFFSNKEATKNSGLGLAIVHGIVIQHGGFVQVESSVEGGTRFDIWLPSVDDRPGVESPQETLVGEAAGERILVVEDEEVLRLALEQILSGCGYVVQTAEDGLEALALIEGGAEADLVVCDVIMPNMGGAELLKKVRATMPDLPFVFSSGYTNEAVREMLQTTDNVSFIAKPYGMPELTVLVRGILDRNGR